MTDFENLYHHLVRTAPGSRRAWLAEHFPADVSPVHQWLALIDSAVSDVRRDQQGWATTRPLADSALAASLIEWALEHGYPVRPAIGHLVELRGLVSVGGGQPGDLPAILQPDHLVRLALDGFAMTRDHALTRAAHLRAQPVRDEDFMQPGDSVTEVLRALRASDDYRDYHRLLDIQRMLTDLAPLTPSVTDTDLAVELAEWLRITTELDPYPMVDPDAPGGTKR